MLYMQLSGFVLLTVFMPLLGGWGHLRTVLARACGLGEFWRMPEHILDACAVPFLRDWKNVHRCAGFRQLSGSYHAVVASDGRTVDAGASGWNGADDSWVLCWWRAVRKFPAT